MISRKEKLIVAIVCATVLILGALSGTETQNSAFSFNEEMYTQSIIPSIKLVGRVVVSGIITIVTLLALRRRRQYERETKERKRTI